MIFDISQEIFSAEIYPGDPIPGKEEVLSLNNEKPDICQLTRLIIGSHTGTHLDAPAHFYKNGKDTMQLELEKCIGECKVVSAEGRIEEKEILEWTEDGTKKLLIKGKADFDSLNAEYMVKCGIHCIGVERSTVGSGEEQEKVHKILLGAEVVIIEGLRMDQVIEGKYFLSALPLKMQGVDGSPVRAVLIDKSR